MNRQTALCVMFLGTWALMRYAGVLPHSWWALLSIVFGSWLVFSPISICVKTLHRRHRSTFNDLPGPQPIHWLYDHLFSIFDEPLASQVTQWINERPYPDGLMHFFGLFGSEYLVPTDHEALADVLSNRSYDYEKSRAFRRYAIRFFGDGLVSQEQEVHKKNRKTYTPIFNQAGIKNARPMLTAKASQVVECISAHCKEDKAPVPTRTGESRSTDLNYIGIVFKGTMDAASILAFGIDLGTIQGRNLHIFESFKTIFFSTQHKRTRFIWHNLLPTWIDRLIPSEDEKNMDDAKALLANSIRDIIVKQTASAKIGDSRSDYLSSLVQSGAFNIDEHIPQLNTIVAAGFESSGGSLSFVIYCFAANPDAQQAVREELRRAKNGREHLDEDEYDRLPVLNAMVMESLRFYPSFPLLLRKAIRDTVIKERFIPRGTYVAICPRAINTSRHLWGPDAERFNLERWVDRSDPENPKQVALGGAPAAACMLSFGYGTRSCVGRNLALAQMKRQIALIAERFQVATLDDRILRPSGLFASTPPANLRLRFTELH